MPEPHCRAGVDGCECCYHNPAWRAFAAEHHFDLPEVDETCVHHGPEFQVNRPPTCNPSATVQVDLAVSTDD